MLQTRIDKKYKTSYDALRKNFKIKLEHKNKELHP